MAQVGYEVDDIARYHIEWRQALAGANDPDHGITCSPSLHFG
ncbi:MAG TPA: hypothetical protein VK003_13675 [Oceanobacillus sp.]|nr:hypothetical protein [Oceanobacillus sp.]